MQVFSCIYSPLYSYYYALILSLKSTYISILLESSEKFMKTSLFKCILAILAFFYVMSFLSSVLRFYTLPHVKTIPQKKGILTVGTTIYDIVIPQSALVDENTVYFAYSLPTPSGNRYVAVTRKVEIVSYFCKQKT